MSFQRPSPPPLRDTSLKPSKSWSDFFNGLFEMGGQVLTVTQSVTNVEAQASTDDRSPVNYAPAIEAALLQASPDAPRHSEPRLEEVLLQASGPAARDFGADIEALGRLLAIERGPQVTRAEFEELRALVLASDAPQLTNLRSAAYSDTSAFDPSGAAASAGATATSSALQKSSNLSDLGSAATARTNLGLGSAATAASTAFDASGAAAAAQTASLQKSSNLSDLGSVATARTNLGLGSAALAASTAFDASGAAAAATASALQKSSNLSDLGSAATARTNLGLGSAATAASTAFDASGAAAAAQTASLQKSSNLSDLGSVATARTNLGLGSAALAASTAFDASGAAAAATASALQKSSNLSDLGSVASALTNLGFAWTPYSAVITAGGSMTVGSITYNLAQYCKLGSLCFVMVSIKFGLGGTANNTLTVTLPTIAQNPYSTFIPFYYNSPAQPMVVGLAFPNNGVASINLYLSGQVVYSVGSGFSNLTLCGFYNC